MQTQQGALFSPAGQVKVLFQGTPPLPQLPPASEHPQRCTAPSATPGPVCTSAGPWNQRGNKQREPGLMSTYCVLLGTVQALCHCEPWDSPFREEQMEPPPRVGKVPPRVASLS